jgi:hypothetical protein
LYESIRPFRTSNPITEPPPTHYRVLQVLDLPMVTQGDGDDRR